MEQIAITEREYNIITIRKQHQTIQDTKHF